MQFLQEKVVDIARKIAYRGFKVIVVLNGFN